MKVPFIDVGSRTKLNANELVLLEADLNYTNLYLSDGQKITVSYHLGLLQNRLLDYKSFVRPNRKTIVNLQFLKAHTTEYLKIKNHKVIFSRRRRDAILALLNKPLIETI